MLILISSVLMAIVALLLVGAVLLQNPKDQGGHETLSTAGIRQVVGVAHATDLLEKITFGLALLLVILILCSSYLIKQKYVPVKEERSLVEQVLAYREDTTEQEQEDED